MVSSARNLSFPSYLRDRSPLGLSTSSYSFLSCSLGRDVSNLYELHPLENCRYLLVLKSSGSPLGPRDASTWSQALSRLHVGPGEKDAGWERTCSALVLGGSPPPSQGMAGALATPFLCHAYLKGGLLHLGVGAGALLSTAFLLVQA